MSQMIAVTYPDKYKAAEVRHSLIKLQQAYLLELEDAVVVTKDENNKIKLQQAVNLTALGAVSGGFWGTLIGLIFLNPLLGAAIGASSGAVSGALSDIGINDQFMTDLASKMSPNTSALFVLVRNATPDKVVAEISKFGGTVLQSSLSHEDESKLQAALNQGVSTAGASSSSSVPSSPSASVSVPLSSL
jgi:uncharacterized membrane protein